MSKIALSIGCPCGIGPEVSVVAAARSSARVLLVGDVRVVERAAKLRGVKTPVVRVDRPTFARGAIHVLQPTDTLSVADSRFGKPTKGAGAAQLAWVDAACDLARHRDAAEAMCTGPVSKEAIVRSGAKAFMGHTEHLQRRLRAREVVMAFWTEKLTTALVTTHLPLAAVPRAITPAAVARATYWLGDLLVSLGKARPKIVVCGLNPHAGESGLLGKEETTRIAPGIARAIARGACGDITGPVPAESALRLAAAGTFDGAVAMYHDQATIAMKLVGFGEAVNVSLGLPIIRTSVDHGTAYDRAGKGTADATAMEHALLLAAKLSAGRRRTSRRTASRAG
jgi:4-hydroxythreonine-4-phosphate dehydrogenase